MAEKAMAREARGLFETLLGAWTEAYDGPELAIEHARLALVAAREKARADTLEEAATLCAVTYVCQDDGGVCTAWRKMRGEHATSCPVSAAEDLAKDIRALLSPTGEGGEG